MGIEDLDDLIKDINSALSKVLNKYNMTNDKNKYNYKKFSDKSPLIFLFMEQDVIHILVFA